MKHTPGPWEEYYDYGDSQINIHYGDEGQHIATVHGPGAGATQESMKANARLIAAAPELFNFVIQYLYSEHGICASHHDAAPYSPEELKSMAEKAIAKAEGAA